MHSHLWRESASCTIRVDQSYLLSIYRFCALKIDGRALARAWRSKMVDPSLLSPSMTKMVGTNISETGTKFDISSSEALLLGLKSFHRKDHFCSKSINYRDRSLPFTLATFSSMAACSLFPSLYRMGVCEPAFARSNRAFPFVS